MEHRSLSAHVPIVRSNAIATYLGLVAAVEGSVVTKPHGFTLVRGPGFFSFCNFAAGFHIEDSDLDEAIALLQAQARECFGFYVFAMSGDTPDRLDERLVECGFEVRQRLVSMASVLAPAQGELDARLVTDRQERADVATFMARQFFWSMPSEARSAIAAATSACGHTVWCVGQASDPRAAVMLVEQHDSVGLFNLCVKPELRSKGIGGDLVRAVQTAASNLGRPVVLQCGEDLVPWYQNLGFDRVGHVTALTLSSAASGDILT